jgi:hypothetical protein
MLAGILFGILYHAVEHAWPGSITVAGAIREFPLFDAIYLSFVTLATLGYGDLLPVSEVARGLAIVEAVSGLALSCGHDLASRQLVLADGGWAGAMTIRALGVV